MTNVSEWSTTAGLNNSSPPNGWPEGMARSAVNDAAREMMAALAKWYQDCDGTLVTAGSGNAFTLATNNVYAALNDIPLLVFRANRANTGAATLQVDSLTAKALRRAGGVVALASGDIAINQLLVAAYNATLDVFELVGLAPGQFETGTAMLFGATAAPSGWTKGVTHDNKALRLTTGTASSGGTTGFTSVFASRTIAQANLPNYNLNLASLTGSVGTAISNGSSLMTDVGGVGGGFGGTGTGGHTTVSLANGAVTFGGSIPSGGSGTAMDFAVQYVDVILATKN